MTRWVVALVLLSCSEKPAAPVGLRVPLPDGWAATPTGGGLSVGPRGRVVTTLELRGGAVPRAAELGQAATAEGASNVLMDEGEGFAVARYTLADRRDGFLAVKRVGSRTVWCASTANASVNEVDDGVALCRGLSSEQP
ncbi:MAG: hypothetical protein JNJ54_27465 [Myxococcaceae bacterium]|nr:hypothetical protein [Myxococcaceae bacterium]